jgi:uncharacterized coiled-coil protein SlyX
MRRVGSLVLGAVCLGLLIATGVSYSKYRKAVADHAQATAAEENMRQRYDQAVGEIVAIQDSLNAIVLGDAAIKVPSAESLNELQLPGTLHDRVLSRIATLKSAVERTKERIAELDTRLKKSGVKITGLERMLAGLRKSVAEKETRIAELDAQVGTLEHKVAGLTTEVETQQIDIADKRREIATVFYAVGSKKELTQAGVAESKGGVLGLGKTLEPTGMVNSTLFNSIDTDETTTIRIPAEKAQVISAQPASSYFIKPISKQESELQIVDPKEFRKVKHVVIVTT